MSEDNRMKLKDLYTRVVETTGLDIVTLESLNTAVANCMADLTSRGYRTFKELHITELTNVHLNNNLLSFDSPNDVRKNLYIRLYFNNTANIAKRCQLNNKNIGCFYDDGEFRSLIDYKESIYYIKGNRIYIEWHKDLGVLQDISYAYYQALEAPKINSNLDEVDQLNSIDFAIRKEFEDAVVFYCAYFYYSRFIKDTDKIQMYQNNYKYYVEDLTHELAYEDDFNEEDAVIKCVDD